MSQLVTPRQIARTAALGFVVLITALAIIHSRGGEDASIMAPLEREQADALASELVRCRTVTTDDAASLEICQRVWAKNRRQFFRPTKKPPVPAGPVPTAASATGKNRDRVSPVEAEHQASEVR
jgi:conjugative transfer region protein TrbK